MLEISLEEAEVVEASEEEDGDVVVALEKETLTRHLLNATIAIRWATFNGKCPYKRAEKANFVEIKEEEEMLLMAYTENNLAGNGAMWYLILDAAIT
jgi:hypothetical protein